VAGFLPVVPAHAGGWVQAKGEAYLRLAAAYEDHEGFYARRTDAYGEWGVTPDWTVSGKIETVDFSTSNVFDSTGYRITARRRLWTPGQWSFTGEAGFLEGAAIGGFRGCENFGGEWNFGVGRSGQLKSGTYFAAATLGQRAHSGNCQTNRAEAVIGLVRPSGWTTTFQYWAEEGDAGRSEKVEFMTSVRLGKIELGSATRTEISGEFEETAFVLSLALRL
tara:strand:+ start:367 stop:1029 length:663 start_codon:yes stop_codon:yes gene_type:complete